MSRPFIVALLLAGGCTRTPLVQTDGDAGEGGGTAGEATSDTTGEPPPPGRPDLPPEPSDDATTSGPEPDTDDAEDGIFLPEPDVSGLRFECDLFAEDCPDGEKCMPWANDGGNVWNATRCSPVVDDPAQVGEPCIVEGSGVSGIDTCELHAMCWDVDPDTLEGTCVAMCIGDESSPSCEDPEATCTITSEGVLNLCIPSCDPLAQDCPVGDACYGLDAAFFCVADDSNGATAGSGCDFINTCPAGTQCIPPDQFATCDAVPGCCSSFCSLDDPEPPCLDGQSCVPWFATGEAPKGSELVGICAVMQ